MSRLRKRTNKGDTQEMKLQKLTIQLFAVCALLSASLFYASAHPQGGLKTPPKKPQQIKACCFKTESGGLKDCNKPMANGLCPPTMVTANCKNRDVNAENLGEARRNSWYVLCRRVKAPCDLRIVPTTRSALRCSLAVCTAHQTERRLKESRSRSRPGLSVSSLRFRQVVRQLKGEQRRPTVKLEAIE